MKNLTLTLLFLGLFSGLSAQYVTIPDANFRYELRQLYTSCFNSSQQLDTTCSAVVNTTVLNVTNLNITNLDGVQYFDGLQFLNCYNNQLTSLPSLPNGLQYLRCFRNQLSSLPALPSGLVDLACYNNRLTSLPSLPDSLQWLDCFANRLTSLPTLPSSLRQLSCGYNQLTNLPTLPSSLEYLWCNNNILTNIPALSSILQGLGCDGNQLPNIPVLSNGLTILTCSSNQLTSLPLLPSSLAVLRCNNNQLSSLPVLPNTLLHLWCNNNQLRSLPALPNTLQQLYCNNNQLTSLPSLPSTLQQLYCNNNQLTNIPALPDTLQNLHCGNNQLTSLPVMTNRLDSLYCPSNQLTSLPPLPSRLRQINCSNNQLANLPALPRSLYGLWSSENPNLSCLPLLPSWLYNLNVSATSISCIPNYNFYIDQSNAPLSLCTNSNQICQTNPMVRGIIYDDANNNRSRDTLENMIRGIPILVSPNNWTSVSDTVNGYVVKLDTIPITNTITPGFAYPYRTFTPSSYSVTTTSLGLLPTSYDFAMQTQPNVTDLVTRFNTWFHRPGFQTSASVNVENIGTIDQSNASISLEIPNGLSVISTVPATGVVTGNTVTWSGENIAIFERKNYCVSLQVPTTMPLGTSLTYTAQATPATTDFTPADNIATETVVVRGSYDPNDKLVNKDRLPNNYVAADEEMLYTIRFQNTGTDTAFTVLIRDTLDLQKLDFSTFRVTGSSHALRTNVRDHGVVEFVFNNINLPDSFVNEPMSHGYVQFRIHPKANLPLGTQIKNRAFIYFDFNTPIITNFATTTVGLLSVSSAELGAGSLSLYPVPVAEQLTVNFNAVRSGEVRYRLLDLQGRLLQEQQLTVTEGENISTMDMSKLGAGMYFLQVVGEQGSMSSKIVKE